MTTERRRLKALALVAAGVAGAALLIVAQKAGPTRSATLLDSDARVGNGGGSAGDGSNAARACVRRACQRPLRVPASTARASVRRVPASTAVIHSFALRAE